MAFLGSGFFKEVTQKREKLWSGGEKDIAESELCYSFSHSLSVSKFKKSLGPRTELLWFGHGCSGHRMLLEHERNYYGSGMDAPGHRMLLEHERKYGLGMDAPGHRMLLEHECGCAGSLERERN